jgi:signal transduction histidine kinase
VLEQVPAAPVTTAQPLTALTPTSWAAGRELAVAEWVEQGRCLGAIGRASAWWIGDWVRYGSARYGDRYAAASRVTGYDVQSLMNMAYVASRFDADRRRPALSYSHHAELAGLAPEDQELWLDRAEAGGLSVRALRAELRKVRQRSATRAALARARLEAAPEHLPEQAQPRRPGVADAMVCPHCGHIIES